MFVLLIIAVAGAEIFAKVNGILFGALVVSVLVVLFSMLFQSSFEVEIMPQYGNGSCYLIDDYLEPIETNVTFWRPSAARFKSNLWPAWRNGTESGNPYPDDGDSFWGDMWGPPMTAGGEGASPYSAAANSGVVGNSSPAPHVTPVTPPYPKDGTNDMKAILALIYTTTCGIMVGANLSGDLENPGKSLPKGTLAAMLTSLSTYLVFATILAATFDRRSLQCEYLVLQKSAVGRWHGNSLLVVIGVGMATLSTALGAMFGAARILQAIARDNVVPISFFGMGTKNGDEPRNAIILTWAIVNGCGYLGGGNIAGISQLLTDFFLTACAFVNLSQMLLALAKAPNYRPTFQYATWWSSGIGFVLSLALMWFLNTKHAAMTCGIWLAIAIYIRLTADEKPWGDVTQAILFRGVLSRLKTLVQRRDHAKFWRSSMLLLAQDADLPLLTLCKYMTMEGLFIIGTGEPDILMQREKTPGQYELPWSPKRRLTQSMLPNNSNPVSVIKAAWLWLIQHAQLEAFVTVGVGPTLFQIYRSMIASAGLGGLVPNTVVVPYKHSATPVPRPDYVGRINEQLATLAEEAGRGRKRTTPAMARKAVNAKCLKPSSCAVCSHNNAYNSEVGLSDTLEYVLLLDTAIQLEKNVMVVRNSGDLDALFFGLREKQKLTPSTIDVWIIGDWSWQTLEQSIALLVQHAHLLSSALGKLSPLRIVQVVQFSYDEEQEKLAAGLAELVEAARLPMPEILVLPNPGQAPRGGMPMTMATADLVMQYYASLNELIRDNSSNTSCSFMALPKFPDAITEESAEVYMTCLDALTQDLPPLCMLQKGEMVSVISTEI